MKKLKIRILFLITMVTLMGLFLYSCFLGGGTTTSNDIIITYQYSNLQNLQIIEISDKTSVFNISSKYSTLKIRYKDLTVENGDNYYLSLSNPYDYDQDFYYFNFNPFNVKSQIPFIKSPGFYKVTFEYNDSVIFTLYVHFNLIDTEKIVDNATPAKITDAVVVGDYIYAAAVYDAGDNNAHVYVYKLDKNGNKISYITLYYNPGLGNTPNFPSPVSRAVLAVDDNKQYLYVAFSFDVQVQTYGNNYSLWKINLTDFTIVYTNTPAYSTTGHALDINDIVYHNDGSYIHLYLIGRDITSTSVDAVFVNITDDPGQSGFVYNNNLILQNNGGTDSAAFSAVKDSNESYLYVAGYTTDTSSNIWGALWKIDLASSVNNYYVVSADDFTEQNVKYYGITTGKDTSTFYLTGYKNVTSSVKNLIIYTISDSLSIQSRIEKNTSNYELSDATDECGLNILYISTLGRTVIGGFFLNDVSTEDNGDGMFYIIDDSTDVVDLIIDYASIDETNYSQLPDYLKDSRINCIVFDPDTETIYGFGYYQAGSIPQMLMIKLKNY